MTNRSQAGRWLGVCGLCLSGFILTGCYSNSLQSSTSDSAGLGSPLVLLGLRDDPDYEEIEYGPRAPLVIPGNAQLPPPRSRMAAADANWPDDPDVRARRERERMRRAAAETTPEHIEEAARPVSRAELDGWGRRFGEPRSTQTEAAADPTQPVSPEELAARRAEGQETIAAEPPRRSLSDPPTGYRRPADTGEPVPPPEEPGFFRRLFGG